MEVAANGRQSLKSKLSEPGSPCSPATLVSDIGKRQHRGRSRHLQVERTYYRGPALDARSELCSKHIASVRTAGRNRNSEWSKFPPQVQRETRTQETLRHNPSQRD